VRHLLTEKDILKKLNWFYSLEMNQVSLYHAQSKKVNDIYLKKTLERVAVIEDQHVKNIADMINQYGGKPTGVGEFVAPLSGKVAGDIIGASGTAGLLKANIALEQKAMADYRDFILKAINHQELSDLLWSNLIDEDLHTAWFSNYM
jgi:bacterioferritin